VDIIGDGELKNSLIKYAQVQNSKIKFKGVVSNDDLAGIYNKYKVFVLLSTHEGNPKTLMEAMSCGMAVVGTNVVGIKQLINHNDNGILVEQDRSLIKDSILSLLQDDKMQKDISNNARRYICSQYSLKSYIKKELELYEEILPRIG